MIRSIREMPLLWQVWALHFITTAFVVAAVCIAVDHYGADYLMKIMKQYHFSPTPLHAMFTERLHTLARGAGCLGALAGAVLGFFHHSRNSSAPSRDCNCNGASLRW